MKKKIILIVLGLLVLAGIFYFVSKKPVEDPTVINTGNAEEKADLIAASSPRPGDTVTSPLTITGEARGYWYFEASFPVTLVDDAGVEIARWHAEAQSDWMTENFVPFKAILTFTEKPTTERGRLMLHKDNPSGLPQNDDVLIIPVTFDLSDEGPVGAVIKGGCFIGGCSGQICSSEPGVASDCQYRPEYACYQDATCERQSDGECGWTMDATLSACLAQSE